MTTMTPAPGYVTGGVDTHLDVHVAAALDHLGGVLGSQSFPATGSGYRQLLGWLQSFGPLGKVGVEGTGSYGSALARHLRQHDVNVVEVLRPNRQVRRRHGKTDTVDAIAAARAVLSGEATGTPKTHDGRVEALRLLKVVTRRATKSRTQAVNQMHNIVATAPDELRDRLRGLKSAELVEVCAAFRVHAADDTLPAVTRLVLRELARRVQHLDTQLGLDVLYRAQCQRALLLERHRRRDERHRPHGQQDDPQRLARHAPHTPQLQMFHSRSELLRLQHGAAQPPRWSLHPAAWHNLIAEGADM